jgi:hypothetical protein
MITDEYVELFLKWNESGEKLEAKSWLQNKGLSTLPMKHGLLLTGSRRQIETAFSVSLENVQPPFELPLPAALKPHVASITLPRPRAYHH